MGSKVSLTITGEVAACTRADVRREIRLQAARGEVSLIPSDCIVALIILSQDHDQEVKAAAIRTLRTLSEDILIEVTASSDTHPRVLDILARIHSGNPVVVQVLLSHANLLDSTRVFLQEKSGAMPQSPDSTGPSEVPEAAQEPPEQEAEEAEGSEADEESDEFKSKYQLAQSMGVGEKIKVALTGDKEWRTLLIKDSNKLVSGAVVKNPRITEAEVLTICKSVIQNEEILRVICMNKEWIKNYQIRKALAVNTKTPLPNALRYLTTLTEKDLASIAKSKNISTVIATQARRFLAAKSKH